jgi:putative tRNA adenosine deaminase-associated protein
MGHVAYFTAVIVRTRSGWRARDIEIDEAETLDELVDVLRESGDGDTALAMLEHEDDWFALVRVDGEDDPRVFVSDLDGATHSIFATVIGTDLDLTVEAGEDDEVGSVVEPWAGELDLLGDLGIDGERLRDLVQEHADDPGAALGEIAEAVGITELLEALR